MDYTKFLDEWTEENLSTRCRPYYLVTTVEDALHEAIEYNDIRPLVTFLEKYPEELSANKKACNFLAKKLRGEVIQGTGKRGAQKKYKEIRDFQILRWVYFFKGYGFNVYNNGMQDAIALSLYMIGHTRLKPVSYETAIAAWKGHARTHKLPWGKSNSNKKEDPILSLNYSRGRQQRHTDEANGTYENYIRKLKIL